jgi:hypothetical protein
MLFSPRWLFLYPGIVLVVVGVLAGTRLALGPWDVGSVVLDVNTLVVCSAMVLIGYQSLWFAVLSKSFASREGLLPGDVRVERLRKVFPLEKALLVSLLVGVTGAVLLFTVLARWNAAGFGRLEGSSSLRLVIPAATLCTLAAQTALSSLLLSVLSLPSGRPPATTRADSERSRIR